MTVDKSYLGRTFQEHERYRCRERIITGNSSQHTWAFTVEVSTNIETEKTNIQIVKWKARLDKTGTRRRSWKKYWQRRKSYNVGSEVQWRASSRAVETLLGSNDSPGGDNFQELDEEQFLDESDTMEAYESQLAQAKAAEAHYKKQSTEAKYRLAELRRHRRHYRGVLERFSEIVNDSESTETDVHDFIKGEKPMWLFGLDYVGIENEVYFPRNGKKRFRFDVMLRRHDNFLDLAELKGPNASLFDQRTRERSKLNAALSTALGQVLTYLEICDRKPSLSLFKPKALIVIGNRRTDNPRHKRLLSGHLARIEIITYDELISRGKSLLKYLDSYKEQKEQPSTT